MASAAPDSTSATAPVVKLRSNPAFTQGQAIPDAIAQLGLQINGINTRLTQIDTQINGINDQLNHQNTQINGINARLTQIDTQINGINAQLNHQNTQIINLQTTMTTGFAGLQTSLLSIEHNSVARVTNSYVRRDSDRLMPLHNVTTNGVIPGFPTTTRQLGAMELAAINTVLTALGLPTNGTLPQKRQRLRVHIGLLDTPA